MIVFASLAYGLIENISFECNISMARFIVLKDLSLIYYTLFLCDAVFKTQNFTNIWVISAFAILKYGSFKGSLSSFLA